MKDGTTYDKHPDPENTKSGTKGVKLNESNPWRTMKKEKEIEKEKEKEKENNNPNYFFIVPWQMY
ncbi:MAG: hypothetical protein ACP5E3_10680 [Bacteroidales bacterium]